MDIQQAYQIYMEGEVVSDPYAAAPDLEYVIYPEEEDYVWRMVVLPIAAVGADLSLAPTDGCSEEEEEVRFESIRSWMTEKGILRALLECPPIARMTDKFGLDLVDGRHRLALANQAGITHVKFLLGAAPGWKPSLLVSPSMLPGI